MLRQSPLMHFTQDEQILERHDPRVSLAWYAPLSPKGARWHSGWFELMKEVEALRGAVPYRFLGGYGPEAGRLHLTLFRLLTPYTRDQERHEVLQAWPQYQPVLEAARAALPPAVIVEFRQVLVAAGGVQLVGEPLNWDVNLWRQRLRHKLNAAALPFYEGVHNNVLLCPLVQFGAPRTPEDLEHLATLERRWSSTTQPLLRVIVTQWDLAWITERCNAHEVTVVPLGATLVSSA